jgi:hypothetical protein
LRCLSEGETVSKKTEQWREFWDSSLIRCKCQQCRGRH